MRNKQLFLNIQNLLKVGVYLNFIKGKHINSVFNNLILGYRQKIAVYHYDILMEYFLLIRLFIFNILRKEGSILFYDDSKRFENVIKFYAPLLKQQVVLGRWVPGTLTNYNLIQHIGLNLKFSKIPDLIFYFNIFENNVLLKEAFWFNIPILSIIDVNTKFLFYYTYVLPGNKQSYKFVIFIFYLLSYYIFKYSKLNYMKKENNKINYYMNNLVKEYYFKLFGNLKFWKLYYKRKSKRGILSAIIQKRWKFL